MLVKEVMVKRIYTVNSKDGFRKVLRVLIKNKISGVPVVNSKKRLVGVISEKDLLIHLFPSIKEFYRDIDYYLSLDVIETEAKKINRLSASQLMTKKVYTVAPEDHVLKACSMLLIHNVRRLPVVGDGGKLVGIVTTNDLYRKFLQKYTEQGLKK